MSSTLLALRAGSFSKFIHFILTLPYLDYHTVYVAGEATTAERNRLLEKKRNTLILINSYLIENGYVETAERLQSEAGQIIGKVRLYSCHAFI